MNVDKVRADFPILQKKDLIYFDNACTTLKPRPVLDAIMAYYTEYTACAGRSAHKLATRTTEEFEKARGKVARFVNAKPDEIVWTKNTTEAIGLVANGLRFKPDDKVVTTSLEHSSGLLPWQRMATEKTASVDFVLAGNDGSLAPEAFEQKIDKRTRLVSLIFASNVTGTVAPLREIVKVAHDNGALVLADAAQAVPHFSVDVRKLGVDFLAFSGHKMLGPTGIGCLYGKRELLDQLRPSILGGETIRDADLKTHVLEDVPHRLEPGIQNYAGAIGFGAAVDYLNKVGMIDIYNYAKVLARHLTEALLNVPGVRLLGPQDWSKRSALAAFNVKKMPPHDVAVILDEHGVCVRSGMHCAYPFHKQVGEKDGSVRASLYFYNTQDEIRVFAEKLAAIAKLA